MEQEMEQEVELEVEDGRRAQAEMRALHGCQDLSARGGYSRGDGGGGGGEVVESLLDQLLGEVAELASWECKDCGKKFREQRHLYEHSRYLHLEPGTCNFCNKLFPSRVQLRRHMKRKHMEQPDRTFLCTSCGHSFNDGSNLRRHMAKVCGVEKVKVPRKKKDFTLQCDQCDKKYKSQRSLTNHQRKKHGRGQESTMAVASILAELVLGVQQQGTAEVPDNEEEDCRRAQELADRYPGPLQYR